MGPRGLVLVEILFLDCFSGSSSIMCAAGLRVYMDLCGDAGGAVLSDARFVSRQDAPRRSMSARSGC